MAGETCGTGGWGGPKAGDPNTTDVLLTATPAFGGIDLNWSLPTTFAEAVAYTTIYRSLLPEFASARVLVNAAGFFYYDKTDVSANTLYYYWIKIVSIHGTESRIIGPAWSTAKPLIADMIEQLTGQIDAGMLAQSLKTPIDQITLNKLGITKEMLARDAGDNALAVSFTELEAHSDQTRALLQQEVLARTTSDSAFVATVNTLYATVNGSIAAVQQQQTAQATKLTAMASQINQVEANVNGNIAQAVTKLEANINAVTGQMDAMYTAKLSVNGLIGGFGIINNGVEVQAGFDVDTFWIGRTNSNKRKPFIVAADGFVYIDQAAINSLTFSKLRDEAGTFIVQNGKVKANYIDAANLVVGAAQSNNYVANSTGWQLNNNGTMYLNGNGGTTRRVMSGSYDRYYDTTTGVLVIEIGELT